LGAIGGYAAGSAAFEYERSIDKKGYLSGTVRIGAYYGGTFYLGGELENGEIYSRTSGYYAAPGIRFHPLGKAHSIDLGIGAYLPFGYGHRNDNANGSINRYDPNINHFFGATIGELTVDFRNLSSRATFAIVLTGGYIYANAEKRTYYFHNSIPQDSENDWVYLQAGVRFGVRW